MINNFYIAKVYVFKNTKDGRHSYMSPSNVLCTVQYLIDNGVGWLEESGFGELEVKMEDIRSRLRNARDEAVTKSLNSLIKKQINDFNKSIPSKSTKKSDQSKNFTKYEVWPTTKATDQGTDTIGNFDAPDTVASSSKPALPSTKATGKRKRTTKTYGLNPLSKSAVENATVYFSEALSRKELDEESLEQELYSFDIVKCNTGAVNTRTTTTFKVPMSKGQVVNADLLLSMHVQEEGSKVHVYKTPPTKLWSTVLDMLSTFAIVMKVQKETATLMKELEEIATADAAAEKNKSAEVASAEDDGDTHKAQEDTPNASSAKDNDEDNNVLFKYKESCRTRLYEAGKSFAVSFHEKEKFEKSTNAKTEALSLCSSLDELKNKEAYHLFDKLFTQIAPLEVASAYRKFTGQVKGHFTSKKPPLKLLFKPFHSAGSPECWCIEQGVKKNDFYLTAAYIQLVVIDGDDKEHVVPLVENSKKVNLTPFYRLNKHGKMVLRLRGIKTTKFSSTITGKDYHDHLLPVSHNPLLVIGGNTDIFGCKGRFTLKENGGIIGRISLEIHPDVK